MSLIHTITKMSKTQLTVPTAEQKFMLMMFDRLEKAEDALQELKRENFEQQRTIHTLKDSLVSLTAEIDKIPPRAYLYGFKPVNALEYVDTPDMFVEMHTKFLSKKVNELLDVVSTILGEDAYQEPEVLSKEEVTIYFDKVEAALPDHLDCYAMLLTMRLFVGETNMIDHLDAWNVSKVNQTAFFLSCINDSVFMSDSAVDYLQQKWNDTFADYSEELGWDLTSRVIDF